MRIAVLTLLLCLCFTADADIYRWVDEDGKVHYGDQPKREAELLQRTTPDFSGDETGDETEQPRPQGDDDARFRPDTPLAQGKAKASARERCDEYRARLSQYEGNQELYTRGEDGQPQRMPDEARQQLIERTRAAADKACAQAKP